LVDRQGRTLAGFRQTFRLGRGSRVLQLEVELDPQTECGPDPWNSYYALRFAWASEAAELWRTVNDTRHRTTARRFEAPLYVEIDDGSHRTAILTGGLPFHRRHGYRMLDSLLVVRGERSRRFQFGVGIDLKHPRQEAVQLLAPVAALCQTTPPPASAASGWLFHIDARNVTATHWEPLLDDDRVAGFRVRLLESAGRSATATLKCFRPVTIARRLNFCGGTISECTLQDGDVQLSLSAHEWVELEARW
jgi:alpha-mannosidase